MKRIHYYIFVARWLYRNRNWTDTRQKYKAMNKEWERKGARKNEKKNTAASFPIG